jgi:hypothetical protein
MSSRKLLAASLAAVALVALARRGAAIGAGNSLIFTTSGAVCRPADGVTNEWSYTAPYGIHRTCSSCSGSPTVICPLGFARVFANDNGYLSSATATVYDRHSTEDVTCTLMVTSADGGSVALNQNKGSAGNAGPSQTLAFELPSPTGPNPLADWRVGLVAAACSVPPATASGFSHVASFQLINSPIPPLTQ